MATKRWVLPPLGVAACLFLTFCGGERTARKAVGEEPAPLLVQKENSWRGGLIGGVLGSPFSGTILMAADKAVRQAAKENHPTAYISSDGFQRVEAFPQGQRTSGDCREIRVVLFQEGRKIKEEKKTLCPP